MKIFLFEDSESRILAFESALGKDEGKHQVVVARDVIDAGVLWEDGEFDLVLLDHDLGGEVYVPPKSPNTTTWWIHTYNPDFKGADVIIHSLNPVGSQALHHAIEGSIIIPFGRDLLEMLEDL